MIERYDHFPDPLTPASTDELLLRELDRLVALERQNEERARQRRVEVEGRRAVVLARMNTAK